ncbi:hypothetical protein [Hymenobacter perfusus]|uniref:Uncharacterized protein n=1 Tax=Hymenobacter perfusus TaxID=1236770 RepID=A0A428KI41_9BACT|nr:hypothetical protein [Hymenobacter perfusus]RSK46101.1 hypothetical protein EI293_02720 [Hymenobacter perfusus]
MLLGHLQFRALPYEQQGSYIIEHGRYLAHRWHENYGVNLYWVGSFFCEIWLEQDCLEMEQFRSFTSFECLDAYLPFLHLPEY